jgi:hypothetical protein
MAGVVVVVVGALYLFVYVVGKVDESAIRPQH